MSGAASSAISPPSLAASGLAPVPCPTRHFELEPRLAGFERLGAVLDPRAALVGSAVHSEGACLMSLADQSRAVQAPGFPCLHAASSWWQWRIGPLARLATSQRKSKLLSALEHLL